MEFSLWDSESGGSQIGATVSQSTVDVTNGRFTVELDFSASAFNSNNRWLEITVDGILRSLRETESHALPIRSRLEGFLSMMTGVLV